MASTVHAINETNFLKKFKTKKSDGVIKKVEYLVEHKKPNGETYYTEESKQYIIFNAGEPQEKVFELKDKNR